jgi:hypothetical protein
MVLLSIGTVMLCFLPFLTRPYDVLADSGYQALSARQYINHRVSTLNYLSLVNPRDLTKNVEAPLTDWTPFGAYLFFGAFKLGLPPGTAGRLLAFLASLSGAIGWVWITSLIGLRGIWRVLGVILAASYCLRAHFVVTMGTQDYVIYAVAPWLLAIGIKLAGSKDNICRRTVLKTAFLCLALGTVYCLKYTGVFMSLAILCFLCVEQLGSLLRGRILVLLSLLALYAGFFALPILGQKALNYNKTGSDLIETVISHHRPRTPKLIRQFFVETVYNASTVLFTTEEGADRVVSDRSDRVMPWIIRLPGILLVIACVFFFRLLPKTPVGRLATLLTVVPLTGFPALSALTGFRYVTSFYHSCVPFWIFPELMILVLLSRDFTSLNSGFQKIRTGFAVVVAVNLLLFMWTPRLALQLAWQYARLPKYLSSSSSLMVPDLSRRGTRDIDGQIRSLIRDPEDVIVPAVYSNRGFGTDVWLELGDFGRLLPLSYGTVAISRTQGDGDIFYGSSPFESSGPVRVILLATDPYRRGDFEASVLRIRNRFKQASPWKMVPAVPPDYVPHLWTTEISGTGSAQR